MSSSSILYSIFAFFLLTVSLPAEVSFDLRFVDPPGTGLHLRPELQDAAHRAARLLGSWLDHSATVPINVKSISDPKRPIIFTNPKKGAEKTHTVAQCIILNNASPVSPYDQITINLAKPFDFSDDVPPDAFDFVHAFLHELTHILGFFTSITPLLYQHCLDLQKENPSAIVCDGVKYQYGLDNQTWIAYVRAMDSFITLEDAIPISSVFQSDDALEYFAQYPPDLYFRGPHTLRILQKPIKLHSHKKASHHHLSPTPSRRLMEPKIKKGQRCRSWSQETRCILMDLGYSLFPNELEQSLADTF